MIKKIVLSICLILSLCGYLTAKANYIELEKVDFKNLWRVTDWFDSNDKLEKYVEEFGFDLPLYERDSLILKNDNKFALFVTGNEPSNYDRNLHRALNRGDVIKITFIDEIRMITSTQGAGRMYYFITLSGKEGLDTLPYQHNVGIPEPQQTELRKKFKENLGDKIKDWGKMQ